MAVANQMISRVTLYRVSAALFLLALWEAAGASGLFFKGVLPSTWFIGKSLIRLSGDPIFWGHFSVTLFEILSGFAIGSLMGVVVGLTLGISATAIGLVATGTEFSAFVASLQVCAGGC